MFRPTPPACPPPQFDKKLLVHKNCWRLDAETHGTLHTTTENVKKNDTAVKSEGGEECGRQGRVGNPIYPHPLLIGHLVDLVQPVQLVLPRAP